MAVEGKSEGTDVLLLLQILLLPVTGIISVYNGDE
jgi:hypothetical protein